MSVCIGGILGLGLLSSAAPAVRCRPATRTRTWAGTSPRDGPCTGWSRSRPHPERTPRASPPRPAGHGRVRRAGPPAGRRRAHRYRTPAAGGGDRSPMGESGVETARGLVGDHHGAERAERAGRLGVIGDHDHRAHRGAGHRCAHRVRRHGQRERRPAGPRMRREA